MKCCMDKMEHKKHPPKWHCKHQCDMEEDMDDDMECCDIEYQHPPKKCHSHTMPKPGCMPHKHTDCCDMDMPKCKTEKTCVKTFTCTYKLYRVCTYRLFKVCPRCGHEYDYYKHPGCMKCR